MSDETRMLHQNVFAQSTACLYFATTYGLKFVESEVKVNVTLLYNFC